MSGQWLDDDPDTGSENDNPVDDDSPGDTEHESPEPLLWDLDKRFEELLGSEQDLSRVFTEVRDMLQKPPISDEYYIVVSAQQMVMQQLGRPCGKIADVANYCSDEMKECGNKFRQELWDETCLRELSNTLEHYENTAILLERGIAKVLREIDTESDSVINLDDRLVRKIRGHLDYIGRCVKYWNRQYDDLRQHVCDVLVSLSGTARELARQRCVFFDKVIVPMESFWNGRGDKPIEKGSPVYQSLVDRWRQISSPLSKLRELDSVGRQMREEIRGVYMERDRIMRQLYIWRSDPPFCDAALDVVTAQCQVLEGLQIECPHVESEKQRLEWELGRNRDSYEETVREDLDGVQMRVELCATKARGWIDETVETIGYYDALPTKQKLSGDQEFVDEMWQRVNFFERNVTRMPEEYQRLQLKKHALIAWLDELERTTWHADCFARLVLHLEHGKNINKVRTRGDRPYAAPHDGPFELYRVIKDHIPSWKYITHRS